MSGPPPFRSSAALADALSSASSSPVALHSETRLTVRTEGFTMTSATKYLIRFPDGTHVVDSAPPGHVFKVGDEALPRWQVSRINPNEQLVDGQVVQFEVWVQPIEPDDYSAG